MHPRYNYFTHINDIAGLELAEDVDFDRLGLRPACLPDQPLSYYLDRTSSASGFGKTLETSPAFGNNELMVIHDLKIWDKCPVTDK
jgi:Trypsin